MDNPYLPSRKKIRWYRFLAQQAVVAMILAVMVFFWFANILLLNMSDWMIVQACLVFTVLMFAIGIAVDRRTARAQRRWSQ